MSRRDERTSKQTKLNRRRSTKTRDNSYLRKHVLPTFGRAPLGAITQPDVRAWVEKLSSIPFRIPAPSRERTEESLALLMLFGVADINALIERGTSTRGDGTSLTDTQIETPAVSSGVE